MKTKLLGEISLNRTFKCVNCGASLWGDHGFMGKNGASCINQMRCDLRVARKALDDLAAQGLKPRWR